MSVICNFKITIKIIKYLLGFCLLTTASMFNLGCLKKKNNIEIKDNVFSYHIPITPQGFDPLMQKGTASRFLLQNFYRPLISFDNNENLVFNAAETCFWENRVNYICQLKKGLKFEDGSPILAKNYKYSFELLFDKSTEHLGFFSFLKSETPQSIKITDERILIFEFKKYSPQVVGELSHLSFSPRKEKKLYNHYEDIISSGPFKASALKKNQYIVLKSNDVNNPIFKSAPRPDVKVYFIEDEFTAVRLYETGQLDIVRNLPVSLFGKYKNDLEYKTMNRMDGMGFSKEISADKNFAKALVHSLNFVELQKIYQSKDIPGCPALSKKLYLNDHCYKFDLDLAKEHFKKASTKLKEKTWRLYFSEVGGEDIKKGMEWFAYQWSKNLGLKINIEPLESGLFLNKIRSRDFDIVRKGFPLNSPSCFEALDIFASQSVNNFVSFKSDKLDQLLEDFFATPLWNFQKSQQLCDQGLKIIFESYSFIPLGEMYFTFLTNKKFSGWYINSLNIMDLEHLTAIKTL